MSIIVRSNDAAADKAATAESPSTESKVASETPAPESLTPEQKESTESGTEETEAKEEVESEGEAKESEESESKEEPEAKDVEKDKPQKKSGFQRRVNKLTAKVASKEQELEYWKQQALQRAPAEPKSEKRVEAAPAIADGKPDPNKFETHAEFVEALTDWKYDQRKKADQQLEQKSKLQSDFDVVAKSHAERVESFKKATPDFDEMLENLDTVPNNPVVGQMIIESENGPALLYALAKDPVEAKRIASLSPLAVARELGKIEARLSKAPESKSPTTKLTQAPKPLAPVGAGGKGSARKSITDPNLTQAEYEALRREQIKRRQA